MEIIQISHFLKISYAVILRGYKKMWGILNISIVQQQKRKCYSSLIFKNSTTGKRTAHLCKHSSCWLLDLAVLEKTRWNNILDNDLITMTSLSFYQQNSLRNDMYLQSEGMRNREKTSVGPSPHTPGWVCRCAWAQRKSRECLCHLSPD